MGNLHPLSRARIIQSDNERIDGSNGNRWVKMVIACIGLKAIPKRVSESLEQ